MIPPLPRLYAIIDPAQTGEIAPAEIARALLAAGVRLIQYRDKRANSREFLRAASEIAGQVRDASAFFIVNDRADVARALGVHGVHLGQEDLPVHLARRVLHPGQWIGCSTHTLDQVIEADQTSADYIAFGPVFPTRSKENPDRVVGLDGLSRARQATRKPLVAIGGITLANARATLEAGADSVAVISDLIGAPDVTARAHEFSSVLDNGE